MDSRFNLAGMTGGDGFLPKTCRNDGKGWYTGITKDKNGFPLTNRGNDQESERSLPKPCRNDGEGEISPTYLVEMTK